MRIRHDGDGDGGGGAAALVVVVVVMLLWRCLPQNSLELRTTPPTTMAPPLPREEGVRVVNPYVRSRVCVDSHY